MRKVSQALTITGGVCVLGAAALLAVIAGQYWRNDHPIILPKPRGTHAVGRSVVAWTDTVRSRELMVFVWYPALPGARGIPAPYIPGEWGSLAARGHPMIPAHRMEKIAVGAIDGAPAAPGARPVLVFLPALGLAPAHYTTLVEDLASHGYLVVGVAPTGSTKNVVFPDGRRVDGSDDPDLTNAQVDDEVIRRWVEDAEFAASHILADGDFGRVADTRRIGVVGHAMGGGVAMQVLARRNHFRAAANLNGGPFRHAAAPSDRPLLVLLAGPPPPIVRMMVPDDLRALQSLCGAASKGCEIRQYDEAGYADFSDAAILPSQFPLPQGLMGRKVVDGEKFQREVADRLLAFFDRM